MSFEQSALTRLRRYRGETNVSLELVRETEEAARRFSGRLFAGLEHTAALARKAGFGIETERTKDVLVLRAENAPGAGDEARVAFALLPGTAAETDDDLMHEGLPSHAVDPSGYSGRILG